MAREVSHQTDRRTDRHTRTRTRTVTLAAHAPRVNNNIVNPRRACAARVTQRHLLGYRSGHGGMGSPFDGRCRRFIIYMCPARRSYVVPGLCAISKASPRVMVHG